MKGYVDGSPLQKYLGLRDSRGQVERLQGYLTAALVWMSSRQLPEVSTAIPLASVSLLEGLGFRDLSFMISGVLLMIYG